jgi:hypothetical protein
LQKASQSRNQRELRHTEEFQEKNSAFAKGKNQVRELATRLNVGSLSYVRERWRSALLHQYEESNVPLIEKNKPVVDQNVRA